MRRSSSWIKLNPRSHSRSGLRLLFVCLLLLLWSAPPALRAATFTATLDRYEDVPQHIAEKVIELHRKEVEAAHKE